MEKYCVYHGTKQVFYDDILKNKRFKISQKDCEWLGKGIYFYELYDKAKWWAEIHHKSAVVIENNILVDEKNIVNFDIVEEKLKFLTFIKKIQEHNKDIIINESGGNKKVRFKLLELYRKSRKQLLTINTFESTINDKHPELGYLEFKSYEKQFCLHDNCCIDFNSLKVYSL